MQTKCVYCCVVSCDKVNLLNKELHSSANSILVFLTCNQYNLSRHIRTFSCFTFIVLRNINCSYLFVYSIRLCNVTDFTYSIYVLVFNFNEGRNQRFFAFNPNKLDDFQILTGGILTIHTNHLLGLNETHDMQNLLPIFEIRNLYALYYNEGAKLFNGMNLVPY